MIQQGTAEAWATSDGEVVISADTGPKAKDRHRVKLSITAARAFLHELTEAMRVASETPRQAGQAGKGLTE